MNFKEFAKLFDHTNLKPTANREDINSLCTEAIGYGMKAVCVHQDDVQVAADFLKYRAADVIVCAVVGFPLGKNTTSQKLAETYDALCHGAEEIDVVMNISRFKSGQYAYVEKELLSLSGTVHAYHQGNSAKIIKVIIETCYLNNWAIKIACEIAKHAGADFIKTSTGFGPIGATIDNVKLIRKTIGPIMGVKAAGGIKTYKDALAMIKAGANRLGCSSTVAILREAKNFLSHT